jgi:phenylalanyl-tRNA synthetase alpha chain
MKEKISHLQEEILNYKAKDPEEFRIRFLGKKSIINTLFDDFRNINPSERKEIGGLLNNLKNTAQEKYDQLKSDTESCLTTTSEEIDLTRPAAIEIGSRHPLSIIRNRMVDIFSRMGYVVYEGPEIEDDFHNFSALNFAEEHPARDMQDTFFIDNDPNKPIKSQVALRTHTSSVQIRIMENNKPPIRGIFPGRVYRNEAISARAHCMFHQVEGLYIDRNVSFADLKQSLLLFAREMFGKETQIRLRPSYFPFTEPSAEMDVSCSLCKGAGCPICKYTGWVEILGCGMVDPNVLNACNIDSEEYTGFAFGIGIERLAMMKLGISDIRLFFENDTRFLKQFTALS